jgi:hypothetical protein
LKYYSSYYVLISLLFLSTACSDVAQEEEEGIKIAKVFDVYLTEEQLLRDLPDELKGEDSINFRTQYIENWVKEQVLVQTAENELPETKKDVDYQLMKYRNSLLIYEYEKQYISERLDTAVSMQEIQKFYKENQDEFFLRDFIVKTVYVKYTNNTPDLDKVSKWYKYKLPADEMNLKQHIDNFAVKFNYDTTNWMYFNDVLKDIPLQDFNKSSFIKNKKEVTFEEGEFIYFLNILDYKLKDELSPIEFEKQRIKSIILNMRTNEIRKVLNVQLYEDALNSKQIIIY